MKKITISTSIFITLIILSLGCSNSPTENNNDTGQIALDLTWKNHNGEIVICQEVVKVRVTIDGPNNYYKSKTVDFDTHEAAFDNLKEGHYFILVEGLDSGNNVIYMGGAEVDVIADRITPVNIELLPAAHPLIGNWEVTSQLPEGAINWYFYFAEDNTYIEIAEDEFNRYFCDEDTYMISGTEVTLYYDGSPYISGFMTFSSSNNTLTISDGVGGINLERAPYAPDPADVCYGK